MAQVTKKDTAETIARMSNDERDQLVNDLIASYPNLADDLMTKIGFGLLDTEEAQMPIEIWLLGTAVVFTFVGWKM